MAKWDERDPRWLVSNREDGKNINGWHWEEKNRLEWCRKRLGELLPALPPAEAGGLRITKVTDVAGEATTSTRKGNKKLALYDLKITVRWAAEEPELPREDEQQQQPQPSSSGRDAGGTDADGAEGGGTEQPPPDEPKPEPYGGTLQVEDFANHSDHDEYVFTATADATGPEPDKRELYKGVALSLKPEIIKALQQLVDEMVAL